MPDTDSFIVSYWCDLLPFITSKGTLGGEKVPPQAVLCCLVRAAVEEGNTRAQEIEREREREENEGGHEIDKALLLLWWW